MAIEILYRNDNQEGKKLNELLMESILDKKASGNIFYVMVGEKGLIVNMGEMGEEEFFKILPTKILKEFQKRLKNRQRVDKSCTGIFEARDFNMESIRGFEKMKDVFFMIKGNTKEVAKTLKDLSETTSINFINDREYNLNIFNNIPLENLNNLKEDEKTEILKIADETTVKFLNHQLIQPRGSEVIRLDESLVITAFKNGLLIHEGTSFDDLFKKCKRLNKERTLAGFINLDFNEELYLKDKPKHDLYLKKLRESLGEEYIRLMTKKALSRLNEYSLQKEIVFNDLTLEDLNECKSILENNYEKVIMEAESVWSGKDFDSVDLFIESQRVQRVDYVFLLNNLLKKDSTLDLKELTGTMGFMFIRKMFSKVFEIKYKNSFDFDMSLNERKLFVSIKGDSIYEDKKFLNGLMDFIVDYVKNNELFFENHFKISQDEALKLELLAKEFILTNEMKQIKKEERHVVKAKI